MLSLNTQPIEKPVSHAGGALEIFQVFKTIQGEGPLAGTPAIFIRLSGCTLTCPWCDTDYTSSRTLMTSAEILQEIKTVTGAYKINLIVLTGGEPLRQDLTEFIRLVIMREWYNVQIETNGTLYLPDLNYNMVQIVCSPKTPKINSYLEKHIDAWKYILDADHVDPNDGLPSGTLGVNLSPARPSDPDFPCTKIYVQPLDVQDEQLNKRNVQAAIASCMKYGYRLSLQQHKQLGLE